MTLDKKYREGIRKARKYVEQNANELRIKYNNDYIAVLEDIGVIARGKSRGELADKLSHDVMVSPDRFVLFSTVDGVLNPDSEQMADVSVVCHER